jgi:hypothetical protein
MAFRTKLFHDLGGFDKQYFQYFEDFDISIRAHRHTRLRYTSEIRVAYFRPRSKTLASRIMLCQSAFAFWRLHGLGWIWPGDLIKPRATELKTNVMLNSG